MEGTFTSSRLVRLPPPILDGSAIQKNGGEDNMDDMTFGGKMTLFGMGGTLITIWLLSLMIHLLKRVFPLEKTKEKEFR
jgi:hypothetical protein